METIIKNAVKVGNGAGILLPKSWEGCEIKAVLIEKPLNIKQDILRIIDSYLDEVSGVYIVGSHARNEQRGDSDIDVLVVTGSIDKKIESGRYNIIMIPRQDLEIQIDANALPLIPMLKEAKVIINSELIEEYRNAELTKKNLRYHIETTKSAMKVVGKLIELEEDKEIGRHKISDNVMYSLVLRLREAYIVDCIIKNKIPTTKELLKLIIKISGGEEAYYAYKRAKEKSSTLKRVGIEQAKKIYEYINKKIKGQEEWLKTKSRENR